MKPSPLLRLLVAATLCAAASLCAFGKGTIELQFRHWGVNDGLSSISVNNFLLSRQGYLWIGTENGLNRFDGSRFKSYTAKRFELNTIWSIQEDATGDIWIEYNSGYARYDYRKDAIDCDAEGFLQKRLGIAAAAGKRKIFIDREGNLWVVARGSLSRYDFASQAAKSASLPQLEEIDCGDLHIADDGERIILLQRQKPRMVAIDKLTMQQREIEQNADLMKRVADRPLDLYADEYGGLWLYTLYGDDILWLEGNSRQWRRIVLETGRHGMENSIRHITSDGKGRVWIATDKCGLFICDVADGSTYNIANDNSKTTSLQSDNVNTVYCDGRGNVWVGYYKKGMSVTCSSMSRRFQMRYMQCGDATALLGDSRGRAWIGTDGNGLWMTPGAESHAPGQKAAEPTQLLPEKAVTCICEDKLGRVWAGTFHNGLYCIDGNRLQNYTTENSPLPDNSILALQPDRTGNIWIGTQNASLAKIICDEKGIAAVESGQYNVHGLCFAYDGINTLYVGTYYGVRRIDIVSGRITEKIGGGPAGDSPFNRMFISSICLDKQGSRLWIGHPPMLSVIDLSSDSLYQLTTDDGLCDNTISSIIALGSDQMLVATGKGVSRISAQKGKSGGLGFHFDSYTNSIGIGCSHFNRHAATRLINGNLLLGTPDGCVEVNSEMLAADRPNGKGKVRFTGLMIAGHEVEPDSLCEGRVVTDRPIDQMSELRLSHYERQITFLFSPTELIPTADTRFAYKVDGLQEEWLYTGESQITFGSFAPGRYTLRVSADDDTGGQSTAAMRIVVSPPFYQSPWAYALYLLLAVAVVALVSLYLRSRQRRKLAEHRQQLDARHRELMNETKLRFYTNVGHDLRTPITLILSPLQIMLRKELDPDMRHKLSVMEQNAKQLLQLVNTLLDFRRIEKGVETVKLSSERLGDFLEQACAPYAEYGKERGIAFSFSAQGDEPVTSDFDKVKKIVNNLLSNAFKFTPEGGRIALTAEKSDDGHFAITVADTGAGIGDEDKKHIFERFFQSENENTQFGSGIGLSIVGEYVKLLGGEISVADNRPCGTLFRISLPSQPRADKSDDSAAEPPKASEAATILVVDDNADIVDFIGDSLKPSYKVLTAANGREALEIAHQQAVDLVVSDVMMPVMDGMELCRAIKSDIATSHIPVILLTAKSADEHKIAGLELGADDYITKPFDFDILKLRIQKFLEWRQRCHTTFSQKADIAPNEITITSLDEQLLTRAIEAVEQHIDNCEFSVEELGNLLGLSRSHLYNKLMSLTGKGPAEFIRTIRIKRGRQLLDESGMQIAEVAYAVGFSTPKRFSLNFKKEYGIMPSEYVKSKKP